MALQTVAPYTSAVALPAAACCCLPAAAAAAVARDGEMETHKSITVKL